MDLTPKLRRWINRLLIIIGIGFATTTPAEDLWHSVGFIHSEFPLTLAPGTREEFLGPLYSSQSSGDDHEWGIHPLFSRATNPVLDSEEWDVVYPIMTYDRFGTQRRWQFFQLLSVAGGRDQADEDARRFTLFPLYFQQRADDPTKNYTALLPFYGTIRNHLFRDEIYFVMLPLYVRTKKKDIVTDNYLAPFFDLRHGDQLSGWQFWPVIGNEVKGTTYRTNSFGTVETEGPYKKFFAAWPFFFEEQTEMGGTNWQNLHAFLPFYLVVRSEGHDTTSCLWPFFTWIDNRELRYKEYGFAWPLFTVARGEGKHATRIFPLWSHATNDTMESDFVLWPLYKANRTHAPPLEREHTRLLFYLASDLREKNLLTGQTFHRRDFWPLFTWRKELDGRERGQILAVIEPVLPNSKSIERNYSPVYALWRWEKNPKTHASSQSLLWNLYRRETTSDSKKCSFLFGMFQYELNPQGRRWRWFFVAGGKSSRPAATRTVQPAR